MKRVAVLTSGGDAPGMNAAIRAVVRTGIAHGLEMFGVRGGYAGLMSGDILPLGARDVGGIIQQGGTMLGSARAPEFKEQSGRDKALAQMSERGIEGVVVIGGNGSQTGAYALSQMGVKVVGVASTIDNDLVGSDITIGVDTALNIALEAIDRLKVTASSHRRAFLVEVMGRDCGYLALMAGIAGGAELVLVPEIPTSAERVIEELRASYQRGKTHGIIVVAEGAFDAEKMLEHFKLEDRELGFELRAITLGHVQRGGAPQAFDRVLATRLGAGAIACLARGESAVVVGLKGNVVTTTPHTEVIGRTKGVDPALFELANVLAR